jgi:S1-C subfamily serine protease
VHRPAARRARHIAGALIALAAPAACTDDGPLARATEPRVVVVAAQPCRRPTRDLGVGVVVGDGLVLTAAHTVDGARRTVTADGAPAQVVALDARTDLALLSAPVDGRDIRLGAPAGDIAVHVATVADAIDVAIVRVGPLVVRDATSGERHERGVLTLRPSVPPGTSGAPVLDDDGRVLGIVVLDNRTDATAYAVTSAEIDRFLRQRPAPADERTTARPSCLG